ncbi:MAG: manganese efflux pump [Treponema sp.]|nr:manganese efflux pump [Treponema sp.]
MNLMLFVNSTLLGVGLAMDAFSVSIVNAIAEPKMTLIRRSSLAGVYAFFQFIMPMIGWLCVHTIVEYFNTFQKFIPWIALILLLYIGGKMIIEAIRESKEAKDGSCAKKDSCGRFGAGCLGCPDKSSGKKLSFTVLIIQGIATSIDALSVGFTIANYGMLMAFVASLVIATVTFVICMAGLLIGRTAGKSLFNNSLSGRAQIFGGVILILIGAEIFIRGIAS